MKKTLVSIVCKNGLGHFRRSVAVLSELLTKVSALEIHVFCEEWQIHQTKDWPISVDFFSSPRVFVHTGELEGSISWQKNEAHYTYSAYEQHIHALSMHKVIREADVVISDNLSSILAVRPDAIMMGSFVWHDVLENAFPDHIEVSKIVFKEKELYAEHHPITLCVKDIVMPKVQEVSETRELGWFCFEKRFNRPLDELSKKTVWIMPGATGALEDVLKNSVEKIAPHNSFEWRVPKAWSNLIEKNTNVRAFDFTREEFEQISLVICRPGIGVITDAVTYQIPILAIDEASNAEIHHNAKMIEQLGIGISMSEKDVENIEENIFTMLDMTNYSTFVRKFKQLETNGISQAVDYLTSRF